MDPSSKAIKEYISLEDHKRIVAAMRVELEEKFEKDYQESLRRLHRADYLLRTVNERLKASGKLHDYHPLPSVHKFPSFHPEHAAEIDRILQMGIDFDLLLQTMKNDLLLAGQWNKIVMTMRLAGYDKFDNDESK